MASNLPMMFSLGNCTDREVIQDMIFQGGGCLLPPDFPDLTGHCIQLMDKNDKQVICHVSSIDIFWCNWAFANVNAMFQNFKTSNEWYLSKGKWSCVSYVADLEFNKFSLSDIKTKMSDIKLVVILLRIHFSRLKFKLHIWDLLMKQ